MSQSQRSAAGTLCVASLLLTSLCWAQGRSPDVPIPATGAGLAGHLDAQGRLKVPDDFAGSLDIAGFRMALDQDGAPRFLADTGVGQDKLFGVPGGCNARVRAIATSPSGLIYLGGDFTVCEDVLVSRVAMYDPAQRRFFALGANAQNGVDGSVFAIALSGNDLYLGGNFAQAGGQPANHVARWNGSRWSALGSGAGNGVNNTVYALSASANGVYLGGAFTAAGGAPANNVARWSGNAWSSLGSGATNGVDASVYALVESEGTLYAGGFFTMAGGQSANRIARWDGVSWSSLGVGSGNGVGNTVNALAIARNELLVGGFFTQAGGQSANRVARWNGSAWSALGTGAANGVSDSVNALLVSGSDLYVGGDFTQAGGLTANRAARWNGSAWSALGSDTGNGTNGSVIALALLGSDVLVAGQFTQAGGATGNNIARWNGSAWSALGTGAGIGLNGTVRALALRGTELYVGGAFTEAGGQPANYVARWNGSVWSTLGSGTANGVNAEVWALAVTGNDLYVGGNFTAAGGQPANYIARWDGTAWSALGSGAANGMDSFVWALAVSAGSLYAGGVFTQAGGQPANHLARWNGAEWTALGSGVNDIVYALADSASGLYAGGQFTQAGGQSATRVARWNGSAWSSLGSGDANGVNDWVRTLAVSGSDLFVGGHFTQAGGQAASYIARWNGTTWFPLGTGVADVATVSPAVTALAVLGNDVYVGGRFSQAGGQPANGLARWDRSAWQGLANDTIRQSPLALASDGTALYVGGNGLSQTPLPDLQSKSRLGTSANAASRRGAISRAAGKLSFVSDASDLVVGDGNGRADVFVRDLSSGTTTRISALAESINAGTQESFSDPAISPDGSRVAFAGSSGQVYLASNGVGRVVSTSATGVIGNGPSGNVILPATGSLALFDSQANNLLPGADGNDSVSDIFLKNLDTGAVMLISRGPNGEPANGPSSGPWASDDGQTIVFSTLATNIVPVTSAVPGPNKAGAVRQATMMRGGGFGQSRIYLSRNLSTDLLGNGDSINVKVTPDGRSGVFESVASNLVDGDTNDASDIFRFEIANGALFKLTRVSVSSLGLQSNGASRNPSISDDGLYVTFETEATNLVELDRNASSDIVVKWLITGEVLRLSRTADGMQPNGPSVEPTLSGDGSVVVFGSGATNLTPEDTNNAPDVFSVALRRPLTTPATSGPLDEPRLVQFALPAPNPANTSCPSGFFSALVDDGPGAGYSAGVFGMEVLLDEPGTRVLAGGLNFGGLIDVGQVGFAGFTIANAANESQRLNLSLTGSPATSSTSSLPVRIRIARRTATTSDTVFETTQTISLTSPYVTSIDLPPAFYEATVAPTSGSAGGAPEGQFFFSLTTSFINRPGGGFQGGAVVGGYHAAHPFGGVSGFAGFCLATPHTTSIRVLSQPSYGATGARDLRLRIQDALQRDVVIVPTG